ncbi:MAG: hypothetical protein LAQ69_46940 [Acidobacteriia bacterium]|nr:hypothetical protein [Terriglobia bacterium]
MLVAFLRGLLAALFASSFAVAQVPAAPQDATIQALLKEVHALRIALERSNQIGPKIQIALARMQLQEERVRNATQQLQDIRDRLVGIQSNRAEGIDRIKQLETHQVQTVDPEMRKQMDSQLSETRAQVERTGALEQQFRAREGEAYSLLLSEQARWNEANDLLTSIERMLAPPQL